MWFILCIVLCSQSVWTEAKKCKEYSAPEIKNNTQLDQYVGTWYGIKKLNGSSSDCAVFRINKTGDVVSIEYNKSNSSRVSMNFTLNDGHIDTKKGRMHLLQTRNRNFTILYSCNDENKTKPEQTVKVLSRNRLLTTNQTVEAKQILKELDVDFDQLLNINQNNSVCHAAGKVPFGNNLNFTTTVPPKRNTNGSKSNGSTAAISFLSFCFTFVAFYLVSL